MLKYLKIVQNLKDVKVFNNSSELKDVKVFNNSSELKRC